MPAGRADGPSGGTGDLPRAAGGAAGPGGQASGRARVTQATLPAISHGGRGVGATGGAPRPGSPGVGPGDAATRTEEPAVAGAGVTGSRRVAAACSELTVQYPGRSAPALRDVSLSLAPGERVLLLGPSGCGKSTLAYALAGLIPRIIEAEVRGRVEPPARAGLLFQDPEAQFCLLTVDDEIAFSLENRCLPPAEMPPRIAAALAATGLDVPFGHPVAALSGGQKQRLALAAVLALEPDVLFLDEPTAQLDPAGAALVLDTLERVAEGRTVVVVEHNLDGLIDWVDRAVLLAPGGILLADGEPAAIFRRHAREIEAYGIWRPRSWGAFWVPRLGPRRGASPTASGSAGAAGGGPGRAGDAPGPGGDLYAGGSDGPRAGAAREVRPPLPAASPRPGSAGWRAGAEEAPLLRLEGVAARQGARLVWEGVTLELHPGEWVAVAGANGSGKTTFLHLVAGLQPPAAGRVDYGPALTGPPGRRPGRGTAAPAPGAVGFVFQNPEHQFVTDSVYDEIALAARLQGLPEAEVAARVRDLLRRFGLEEVAGVHPYTLSQGQKRRLSVASMLVVPRPLLVLDEPTFGQDARTATALVEELVALHRQGVTLVMATHDLELAAAAASRLLVFGQGRLLYDGPPAAFLEDEDRLAAAGLLPARPGRSGQRGPATRAHPGRPGSEAGTGRAAGTRAATAASGRVDRGTATEPVARTPGGRGATPPLARVHPAWKLLAHLVMVVGLMAVHDPAVLAAVLAVPILLGVTLGGMGVRAWLRGLAPFLLVAATRTWTLGAFGEGQTEVARILWYRLTAEGLEHGLEVGLRILNFGALGLLYARTTGVVDLVLGLMQQWRLSPRWAYGILAALRFIPLLEDELRRIRQAYRIRGLGGTGGVTGRLAAAYRYSLALLVHAVREAETVAVALQARGFDGSRRRTFYRTLEAGWREVAYGLALVLLSVLAGGLAWWLRRGA